MVCSKNNNGFALLEVAIVLLLFTVLAGISAINVRFFDRMIVRVELEKLHTICKYLQQSAMVSNEPYTITFDCEHKKYAYNNTAEQLPAHVCFGACAGAKGPPSAPTHPISSPITFADNSITFYPSGIVQSGAIYLMDTSGEYMCALSCGVSHVSYLRTYEYDGAWHLLS
jgi:prepilin-type N-terminal cleavage/methylation domain-containing protein